MAGAPARTARIRTRTRTISASWPSRGRPPRCDSCWPASRQLEPGRQIPPLCAAFGIAAFTAHHVLACCSLPPLAALSRSYRRTCPLPRNTPAPASGPTSCRNLRRFTDGPQDLQPLGRACGDPGVQPAGSGPGSRGSRAGRDVSTASGPRNEPAPGSQTYSTARIAAALESLCHLLLGVWGLTELRWFGVICVMLADLFSDTSC